MLTMECREFAEIVRDYLRQEWMSPAARARADQHLAQCENCRSLLRKQTALSSALTAVALEERDSMPSFLARDNVMAAFRKQQAGTQRAAARRLWWAIPAAAAILWAVVTLTRPVHQQPPPSARAVELPRSPQPDVQPVEPPLQAMTESQPPVLRPRRSASRPPVRYTAAPAKERVTDFMPLRYGRPLENGDLIQVFRVQLSRAELLKLGLPVSPDPNASRLQADVLLGEDGLAKAIRFVY